MGVRFDVLGLVTQVGFDTLGSGPSRMLGMVMQMRWVALGLSSRGVAGVGYPVVVWLSRLWGDLLVSGRSKGKRVGIPHDHGPPIAWVSPRVFPGPHPSGKGRGSGQQLYEW